MFYELQRKAAVALASTPKKVHKTSTMVSTTTTSRVRAPSARVNPAAPTSAPPAVAATAATAASLAASHLPSPTAAAVLNRLLQQHDGERRVLQAHVTANVSSVAAVTSAQSHAAAAAAAAAAEYQPPSVLASSAGAAAGLPPAVMRYAGECASSTRLQRHSHRDLLAAPAQPAFSVNSRATLPNLFLTVNALQQHPATSLYQAISNTISSGYQPAAYGLNYSNALNTALDSATASTIAGNYVNTLSSGVANLKSTAAEQLEKFIQTEASKLSERCAKWTGASTENAENMRLLSAITEQLSRGGEDVGVRPLQKLRDALVTRDLSAFQINFSGLMTALTTYLAESGDRLVPTRLERLRRFAGVFMAVTVSADRRADWRDDYSIARARFQDHNRPLVDAATLQPFKALIAKVMLTVERLEQFSVRATNLSGNLAGFGSSSLGIGGSSHGGGAQQHGSTTYLRGAQALRFFQSHQIRCNLRRHPSCKQLREWRRGRGSIKVSTLAEILARMPTRSR